MKSREQGRAPTDTASYSGGTAQALSASSNANRERSCTKWRYAKSRKACGRARMEPLPGGGTCITADPICCPSTCRCSAHPSYRSPERASVRAEALEVTKLLIGDGGAQVSGALIMVISMTSYCASLVPRRSILAGRRFCNTPRPLSTKELHLSKSGSNSRTQIGARALSGSYRNYGIGG